MNETNRNFDSLEEKHDAKRKADRNGRVQIKVIDLKRKGYWSNVLPYDFDTVAKTIKSLKKEDFE